MGVHKRETDTDEERYCKEQSRSFCFPKPVTHNPLLGGSVSKICSRNCSLLLIALSGIQFYSFID